MLGAGGHSSDGWGLGAQLSWLGAGATAQLVGGWGTAQLVKCWLCKQNNLSSILRTNNDSRGADMALCVCGLSATEGTAPNIEQKHFQE